MSTLKRIALLLVMVWSDRMKDKIQPERSFVLSPKETMSDKWWKVSIEEVETDSEWIISQGNVHIGLPT